jgi:hypothetical protein
MIGKESFRFLVLSFKRRNSSDFTASAIDIEILLFPKQWDAMTGDSTLLLEGRIFP